jgi:hypothetical protein
MEIIDCVYTSLKAVGGDEGWIHGWIVRKPHRLGLGAIEVQRHELIRHDAHGHRLEMIAYRADIDTFYVIEIMLDGCDPLSGARMLSFWSRERLKHPGSRHVAVLAAENLYGRCRPLLEGLPQILPFIGIDIKVLALPSKCGVATILPTVIVRSPDVKIDVKIDAAIHVGDAADQRLKPVAVPRPDAAEAHIHHTCREKSATPPPP